MITNWLLLGLIIGAFAIFLDSKSITSSGIVGPIILGMLGAVLGGTLAKLVISGGPTIGGFDLITLLIVALGAGLLLLIRKGIHSL